MCMLVLLGCSECPIKNVRLELLLVEKLIQNEIKFKFKV